MKELSPFAILYEEEEIGPISQLAFSPQGLLAIGGQGADVWDLSKGTISHQARVASSGAYLPPLAFSPDGCHLAIGQNDGCAIFDLATGTRVQEHRHNGEALVLAWSPDGRLLASCSEYGQYHVWQPLTGEVIQERRFDLPPSLLLWLPDGRLVTNPFTTLPPASSHWQVQIWNAAQTQGERLIDDGERRCDDYTCAAFAARGAHLALGTQEGSVQIWRIERGTVPVCSLRLPFHANTISGLAWSSDEQFLATGSLDGHVALWDTQGKLLYHACARQSGDMGIHDVAWWKDVLAVASVRGVALYRIPQTDHFLL